MLRPGHIQLTQLVQRSDTKPALSWLIGRQFTVLTGPDRDIHRVIPDAKGAVPESAAQAANHVNDAALARPDENALAAATRLAKLRELARRSQLYKTGLLFSAVSAYVAGVRLFADWLLGNFGILPGIHLMTLFGAVIAAEICKRNNSELVRAAKLLD